jgi:hypothetical protein
MPEPVHPRPIRRRGSASWRWAAATAAAVAWLALGPVSGLASAGAAPLAPPAIPTTGAYLGAFVAPHQNLNQAQSDVRLELSEIGNFDGVLGRPLGLVHVFQNWRNPVRNAVLAALASTGATPVIDWACTSDASVTNDSQDALITSYARSLAAYGHPVFLRWFWEMNLVNEPRTSACLAGLGANGYVAAWQHIHAIFESVGATNVAFVWCPSIQSMDFAAPYYPGDQYVDWIGFDGYDRQQSSTIITTLFQPFYEHWLPNGKPILIGETGATTDQRSYLAALATQVPADLPGIKAVIYYDSKSTSDWTLADTPGDLGLSQFIDLGELPYFDYPFFHP